jgi:hypothetical protein
VDQHTPTAAAVTVSELITRPPDGLPLSVLEQAIAAGRMSPCQKSRRGAAVFRLDVWPSMVAGVTIGAGFNGQPPPWRCDGTCKRAAYEGGPSICSLVCRHAEQRAIALALVSLDRDGRPSDMLLEHDIVHIKVNGDGMPVAGGGPSCIQCSTAILDARLAGVWLLEMTHPEVDRAYLEHGVLLPGEVRAIWRRYTAETFHDATLLACKLVMSAPPVTP